MIQLSVALSLPGDSKTDISIGISYQHVFHQDNYPAPSVALYPGNNLYTPETHFALIGSGVVGTGYKP